MTRHDGLVGLEEEWRDLDADDYQLLEQVRERGSIACGTLGYPVASCAAIGITTRPLFDMDKAAPRNGPHYVPHWKREESRKQYAERREATRPARCAAAQIAAAWKAAQKEQAEREEAERQLVAERKLAAELERVARKKEEYRRQAEADRKFEIQISPLREEAATSGAKQARIARTKIAIMRLIRTKPKTRWFIEDFEREFELVPREQILTAMNELVSGGYYRVTEQ